MRVIGRLTTAQTTVAVAALVVAATGSSIAIASGSGSTTYFGCVKSGALSKVGTHRPAHCAGGHIISWNQRGPRGATGPRGPRGIAGTPGTDGTDGRTVLNGSGAPSGSDGSVGDFYLDTVNSMIFGPKNDAGWGSGTSLVGAPGNDATGGFRGLQAPTSISGTTQWQAPSGVHIVLLEMWGAGGGGCGGTGPEAGGGGAGGSGGYYRAVVPVTPGETYSLIVGEHGVGCGASAATDGGSAEMKDGSDNVIAAVSGGKAGGTGGDSVDSGSCTAGAGGDFGNGGDYLSGPNGMYHNGPIGTAGFPGACGAGAHAGAGGFGPDGIAGSYGYPHGFGFGGIGQAGNSGQAAFNGGFGYWILTW